MPALYTRTLPDGLRIEVWAMLLGRARLIVTDGLSVFDGYCYDDRELCLRAARLWSGEHDPIDGWTRHLVSGRRRINGDPATEQRYW